MRVNTRSAGLPSGVTAATAAAVVGSMRRTGSRDTLTNAKGEFNASSYEDLVRAFMEVASKMSSGELAPALREASHGHAELSAAERNELFVEAFYDRGDETKWAEIATSIGLDTYDAVARTGFMRRILARGEVAQGAWPRFRIRHRNVEAFAAVTDTTVQMQQPRDGYVTPNEFPIVANPFISDLEMSQGSPNLLEEKFADATEHFMVVEDRLVKKQLDLAAPLQNNLQLWSGSFGPTQVSYMQKEVTGWGLPVATMIISIDLLSDLQIADLWGKQFGPVTQLELLMTGKLGVIFGMEVWTDGVRNPRLRVLDNGECYVISTPEMLGGYTDRGPIQASPRGPEHANKPGRGFMMSEQLSIAVTNARAVCRGRKLNATSWAI